MMRGPEVYAMFGSTGFPRILGLRLYGMGCVVVMLVVGASAVVADTLQVPSADYPTIQSAIDAAVDGDTVQVAAGTYYENLTWSSKSIALIGAGADVTIVDGGGAGRCLTMTDVPATARVEGFTFTGGSADWGAGLYLVNSSPTLSANRITANSAVFGGGGMELANHSSPALSGNTISDNAAAGPGGGLSVMGYSSPTLTHNTISRNSASKGGGLYAKNDCSPVLTENTIADNVASDGGGVCMEYRCYPALTSNTITGNTATQAGGGLDFYRSAPTLAGDTVSGNSATQGGALHLDDTDGTLTNVTITGNSAGWGGGLFLFLSSPTVTNTTITDNSASDAGGLFLDFDCFPTLLNSTIASNTGGGVRNGGSLYPPGTPVITNCILWGNGAYDLAGAPSTVTYSEIGIGFLAGPGNISADPMFVGDGDYHLKDGSPCIDKGTNAAPELPLTDKDGDPRIFPDGGIVDMGAYEWQGPTNRPPVAIALVNGAESAIVEQQSSAGTTVILDGSQSYDPDGDELAFAWDFTSDGVVDSEDPATPASYNLGGPYTATLTVTDPHDASDTDTVTIAVEDTTAPSIIAPAGVEPEQTQLGGRPRDTVDLGTAVVTDNCDGDVTVTNDPPALFPLGETKVTWTATDASGNSATTTQTVTVVDTTPPTIDSVSASPSTLWPPNHKMVDITLALSATDICDAASVCQIVNVTSNEPINGLGDGHTAPDWEITGDLTVNLRAERAGGGSGRVYTIHVECTDASGNAAVATVDVTVPHDKGKGKT